MDKRFLIPGIIVYGLVAIFSVGFNHHDEHFQILEFANYKLGNISADALAWEFDVRLRPAFMPSIVVFLYRLGLTDPFLLALLLRLLSAALSLYCIWVLFKAFNATLQDNKLKQWLALLLLFSWFGVFIGVRFSAENWAGTFFMLGLGSSLLYGPPQIGRQLMIAGIFMGLAFLSKYQAGFLILGFYLWWLARKVPFQKLFLSATICAGVIGLGFLLDRWFYGEWVFAPWHYIEQNMILGKLDHYGGAPKPFWFYVTDVIEKAVPPISILLILATLVYIYHFPKHILTVTFLFYFLAHCTIGHKEIRYLFPLAEYMPLFMVLSWQTLEEKSSWFIRVQTYPASRLILRFSWFLNLALLAILVFHPPKPEVNLYQKIYRQYQEGADLYYLGQNPYVQLLEIHFYRRAHLNTEEVKSLPEIPDSQGKPRLLATQDPEAIQQWPGSYTLLYQSFPNWMSHVNVNDWMSRTQRWFVYELKD